MPQRDALLSELNGDDEVGILLLAQLGGVPNELQLFVQTAIYDKSVQGLRDRNNYMIRVLGVSEHRLSLGLFGTLFFAEAHPILLHHNEAKMEVHFEGQPGDMNALVLDLIQAHASTFGPWREFAGDLNREMPLSELLQQGEGRLGTMPQSAAERMQRVLAHYGLQSRLESAADSDSSGPHGGVTGWKLLGVGDSYFVALDFAVDTMGKKPGA